MGHVLGDVALEPGLVGAAPLDVGVGLRDPARRAAHRVEPRERPVDVALLCCQLGIGLGHARLRIEGASQISRLPAAVAGNLRRVRSGRVR